MVETANGGWWAHLVVGALTGLLVAASMEGAARWWVLGAVLAVYAVVVWYLSPTRITWVDGSVLRRGQAGTRSTRAPGSTVLVSARTSPTRSPSTWAVMASRTCSCTIWARMWSMCPIRAGIELR